MDGCRGTYAWPLAAFFIENDLRIFKVMVSRGAADVDGVIQPLFMPASLRTIFRVRRFHLSSCVEVVYTARTAFLCQPNHTLYS